MISFLITHYNRPKSLKLCIQSIRSMNLKINHEIIVSDDCSKRSNIDLINKLHIDKLVLSPINTGLASNINRGIKECDGDYIVYIQEDFGLNDQFSVMIDEILDILTKEKAEMIRLRSNLKFKDYNLLTKQIKLIPRFSLRNFLVDHYRYSDHPFVVKKSFFCKYGKYKENVNTIHGEDEYMIRMMKLNPKIALVKNECVDGIDKEGTVREELRNVNKNKLRHKNFVKPLKRIVNSLRFKFEYIFYNPKKRTLLTIKNLRK